MSAGEQNQASGSRFSFIYGIESSWGTAPAIPNDTTTGSWHRGRPIPGETMDQGISLFRSQEMLGTRGKNPSVRGNQDPMGSIPFELSPSGWNHFFYQSLGGVLAVDTVTGPTSPVAAPSAPSGASSGTGGTIGSGSYQYKVTALTAVGETLPSTASTAVVVSSGTTNLITLTLTPSTGATGYKIYKKVSTTYRFVASVGAGQTTWVDYGIITPSYAAPVADTSGSAYQHVFSRGLDVPAGMTIEKQFPDVNAYYLFLGCRVDKFSIDFQQDKIVAGTFDMIGKYVGDPTETSIYTSVAGTPGPLVAPTNDPYTSKMVSLTNTTTSQTIATAKSLKLNYNNNFYSKSGFVLGSDRRNNLRPGDVDLGFTAEFQFTDTEAYAAALRGDKFGLNILASNGIYSHLFAMTNFQYLPSKMMPKGKNPEPLTLMVTGEANFDTNASPATELTMTILTPDSTLLT